MDAAMWRICQCSSSILLRARALRTRFADQFSPEDIGLRQGFVLVDIPKRVY
jgi:hypothetical protein